MAKTPSKAVDFDTLDFNNPLFKALSVHSPQWWKSLIEHEDINIQIRKSNYIDVYYNGGAIIKELKYSPKTQHYAGKIHFQYIPLANLKNPYVPYKLNGGDLIDEGVIKSEKISSFNKNELDNIRKRISLFYGLSSEKGIQASFIKNDPHYLDAEFEYNDTKQKLLRIDLVRVDVQIKRIVLVEIKTMGDPRLYNNEITQQLKNYNDFIIKNKDQLLKYYQKLFAIKKNLNILPDGIKDLPSLDNYAILEKPLLLFGDCEQDWINKNSMHIDKKIYDVAIGAYYFGKPKYSANILTKTKGNRHIF